MRGFSRGANVRQKQEQWSPGCSGMVCPVCPGTCGYSVPQLTQAGSCSQTRRLGHAMGAVPGSGESVKGLRQEAKSLIRSTQTGSWPLLLGAGCVASEAARPWSVFSRVTSSVKENCVPLRGQQREHSMGKPAGTAPVFQLFPPTFLLCCRGRTWFQS